jgi:hypothetical protein
VSHQYVIAAKYGCVHSFQELLIHHVQHA